MKSEFTDPWLLAHKIRTSSTQLFEAVKRLRAKLRWCVTGTPVQNGLEDLGSLVAFLQIPMLDSRSEFKQYIIDPLMKNSGGGSTNLRVLLDSICLRRLNTLLDLPDVDQVWQEIEFSDAEIQHYQTAELQMSDEIKHQVNLEKSKRGYFSILELEIRLRRICNHGTFEKPIAKDFEEAQVGDQSMEASSTLCSSCQIDLSDVILVDSLFNGHYTTCGHLICSRCLPRFEQVLATAKGSTDRLCPLCGKQLTGDYLLLDRPENPLGTSMEHSSSYFKPHGVSSKINALLENIAGRNSSDKRFEVTILFLHKKTLFDEADPF
jgi:hypothetical protein